MFNKILSPGEKVKKIRKQMLRVTQKQLAGQAVTRGLLSQIENGKVHLTESTANIIAENIDMLSNEKNIDLKIDIPTVEYLLQGKDKQEDNIINNCLKELKLISISKNYSKFKKKLNEIERKLEKISEGKKEKIYELASISFYDFYEYQDSEFYILKCYNIAAKNMNNNKMIKYISKRINIYSKIGEYEKILNLKRLAETILESNDVGNSEALKSIYFNTAIALKRLEKYKACVNTLSYIESVFKLSKHQLLDVKTMIARCYTELEKYKQSEEIYYYILDKAIETNYVLMIALTYANMAELFLKMNKICDAETYIEKSIKIKDIKNDNKLAEIYYDAFIIYISKSDNITKVRNIFYDTLHKVDIVKNRKLKIKLINNMCNYCIKENAEDDLLKVLKIIEDCVKSKELICEIFIRIFYRSYAFLKQIDSKDANYVFLKGLYIDKILDKQ